MKIALTTDHTGLAYGHLYQDIKDYLTSLGHEVLDYGPNEFNPEDDYPDLIFPAAKAVASSECEAAIIMGGSGQGEAMAANRINNVRCTLFYGPAIAKHPINAEGDMSTDPYEILRLSRRHNHANVLSLAVRFLSFNEAKDAIKVWLETPYDQSERHVRRVNKLSLN